MENHQKTEKNLNDLNQHLIELELGIKILELTLSKQTIVQIKLFIYSVIIF